MAYDDVTKTRTGWRLQTPDADLALAVAYALFIVAFYFLLSVSQSPISSAPGLGMVLFAPGYALIAALFPGKADIGGTERAALSFGMSVMAAAFAGLALYFSPFGFSPGPLFVSLALFTAASAVAAVRRRQGIAPESRYRVDFGKGLARIGATAFPAGAGRLDRALVVALALAILASASFLSYAVLAPAHGEAFTELYLLGPDGKAGGYPVKFHLGDAAPAIVGVANHEYRDVTYDLVVMLDDGVNSSRLYEENIAVKSGQAWEKTVELKPDLTGTNLRVEFLLFADGNYTAPYRDLWLMVNVTQPLI